MDYGGITSLATPSPTLLLGGSTALARQRAFLFENEFADDAAHPGGGSGHGEQIFRTCCGAHSILEIGKMSA